MKCFSSVWRRWLWLWSNRWHSMKLNNVHYRSVGTSLWPMPAWQLPSAQCCILCIHICKQHRAALLFSFTELLWPDCIQKRTFWNLIWAGFCRLNAVPVIQLIVSKLVSRYVYLMMYWEPLMQNSDRNSKHWCQWERTIHRISSFLVSATELWGKRCNIL